MYFYDKIYYMKIGYNEIYIKVKDALLELIKNTKTDNRYLGFNVDKENEKLLEELLKLENILFNFDLLKENNKRLYIQLQERYREINDFNEKNILHNLMRFLIDTPTDVDQLAIVNIYVVLKKDADVFKGALANTPFSKIKLLASESSKKLYLDSEIQLNSQTERINNYLQYNGAIEDDIQLSIKQFKENLNQEKENDYYIYLITHYTKAGKMKKSAIAEEAKSGEINEVYYDYFIQNFIKENNLKIEPGYLHMLQQEKNKTSHL